MSATIVLTFSLIFMLMSCGQKSSEKVKVLTPESKSKQVQENTQLSQLKQAIDSEDTQILQNKLTQYQNIINFKFSNGETALTYALKKRYLLNKKSLHIKAILRYANVDIKNSSGDTPLHLAVKTKDLTLVKAILSQSPNLSIVDKNQKSAFELSLIEEENEIAIALILSGTKLDRDQLKAFKVNNPETLESLNTSLKLSDIILDYQEKMSTQVGESGLVNLLKEAIENNENLYIDYLFLNYNIKGHLDGESVITFLLNSQLSDFDKSRILEKLVRLGLSPNGAPNDLDIPLLSAVEKGDESFALKLLELGADINMYLARNAETALCKATKDNNISMLRLLLFDRRNPQRKSTKTVSYNDFGEEVFNTCNCIDKSLKRGQRKRLRRLLSCKKRSVL